MEFSEYDATFEKFLSNIALTQTQANQIDEKVSEMFGFFMSAFGDDIEFYVQGSYATGTTVKPLTQSQGGAGEYDVDIVIERKGWDCAADALEELEELMSSESDYTQYLVTDDRKDSCVRLEYAPDDKTGVGFHVDIVPILEISGKKYVARRETDTWADSDSLALIEWTKNFQNTNPYATSTLLALKRLRDVGDFTIALTSIILLSIFKKYYRNTGTYVGDLLNVLARVDNEFSTGLSNVRICNPINEDEDLLKKMRDNPTIFSDLQKYLRFAHETIAKACTNQDVQALRKVLSSDFPMTMYDSNVESLRENSLQIDLSGKLRKGSYISADAPHGNRTDDNPFVLLFFERSKQVTFTATEYNEGNSIYWQVNNARGAWDKRGNLFYAMDRGGLPGSSKNPAINHEHEEYLGSHWIRYFAASGSKVEVWSEPFTVRVLSSSAPKKPIIRI